MARMPVRMMLLVLVLNTACLLSPAQGTPTPYLRMAPIARYLIGNRNAEIALARSAAPKSISDAAEVMVLGPHGFEVAAPGTNHFVCLVERSWDSAIGDRNFWNPNIRGPNCLNAAAVRSYLPIILMKAKLALAGKSQAEIATALQAAFRENKLPPQAPGAMCYMLSKQGYLDDQARNWHPHLMFFVPFSARKTWGAGLPGSPILSSDDATDQLTIFMIPVARWSDGTLDSSFRN